MSQLAAGGSTPEPKQGRCPFLFSLGVSDDAYEHNPHQQQQNHQQPQHLSASSSSSSSSSSGSLDTAATAAPAAGEGLRRNGSSFASTSSSADTHQSGATSSSHSHPQPAQPSKMHRSPSGTFQAWKQVRDTADSRSVVLSRRQLRRLGRAWTLEEVGRHKAVDDAWIAVNGRVYDITEHLIHHPGWEGAGVTTVLSIIAHLGTDCSSEFEEIHRPWPVAWRQLAAYDIGGLLAADKAAA